MLFFRPSIRVQKVDDDDDDVDEQMREINDKVNKLKEKYGENYGEVIRCIIFHENILQ
jgi:hypothetical protein